MIADFQNGRDNESNRVKGENKAIWTRRGSIHSDASEERNKFCDPASNNCGVPLRLAPIIEALAGEIQGRIHFKVGNCNRRTDESIYWLEMLIDAGMIRSDKATKLIDEANQLVAILTASYKTASWNNAKKTAAVSNQKSAISKQR